ncbi:MAG: hypothetical protein OXQ29_24480 [Rhodospirillaceae bacterium]|nr:hypothetical protein [Rhodospirillaceae bacterium]
MITARSLPAVLAAAAIGAVLPAALAQTESDIPRTPEGYPDLNGTWYNGDGILHVRPVQKGASLCIRGCESEAEGPAPARVPAERPNYKPEFLAMVRDLDDRQVEEDPALKCFPPGVPRIGPPDKIVQTRGQVVFLYNDITGSHFRTVPTDGRGHRTDIGPSYLGDAVGYWDGDTLVVETTNFNEDTWLTDDGTFHTTDLRVVERLWREGDSLNYQATAFDPAVLAEPWEKQLRVATLDDRELLPAPPCIERDLDLIIDGSHHDNRR